MLRNWDLGKVAGIDVRIHWSFWLIVLLYSFMAASSGGLAAAAATAVTLLLVFACVLAHEFGHAFAARAFGIATLDITLLPIGGVARLASLPEKPVHELLIAVAGPAVNVVIALALIMLAPMKSILMLSPNPVYLSAGQMMENLLFANVGLVLFNMLPAFPMDGGRVLRSLLAMRIGNLRATKIAARVGRWMALLFVVAGVWWLHLELCLVGLFVSLAGTAELMTARRRSMPEASASPMFQFQWASMGPGGSWQFSSYPGSEQTAPHGSDVVDAVDVREVKSPDRRIGY